MSTTVQLRRGTPEDADALTELFLASRATAMPYLPRVHSDEETHWWMRNVVLAEQSVWVAEDTAGRPAGFAARHGEWLEHLYLRPDARRQGIGSALLDVVRAEAPGHLLLRVFRRNTDAVAFYVRHGFRLVDTDDGSRNEEGEPDAGYAWP